MSISAKEEPPNLRRGGVTVSAKIEVLTSPKHSLFDDVSMQELMERGSIEDDLLFNQSVVFEPELLVPIVKDGLPFVMLKLFFVVLTITRF